MSLHPIDTSQYLLLRGSVCTGPWRCRLAIAICEAYRLGGTSCWRRRMSTGVPATCLYGQAARAATQTIGSGERLDLFFQCRSVNPGVRTTQA